MKISKLTLQLMMCAEVLGGKMSSSFPPLKTPVYKKKKERKAKPSLCCILSLSSCRFLLLWSAVLIMYPTTLAVIALTFSNYVLQPAFQNCLPPYVATRLLATTCVSE